MLAVLDRFEESKAVFRPLGQENDIVLDRALCPEDLRESDVVGIKGKSVRKKGALTRLRKEMIRRKLISLIKNKR